ncbi:hypothetical protein EV356DRAFT_496056 [Viridothelium virens]|uniref:tRNA(Phe) (4-demethylwyosine(37)-C(7)) aminocarboxypropyltransferase n=1 Tax=Viridothelium virens TaxID=1048519 RepID=A0A6A6HRJ9_VIRVR|nr:hypothetical protein EV356DRAFT_496056 [Viridothelium virens]
MFSRGNISEKSRLLSLPSVAESVQRGREKGNGCAAVDLYGGIGYFAFSYVKAGVRLCLCWEINGWSVEGLRRGAVANKWSTQVVIPEGKQAKMGDEANEYDIKCDDSRLLVFQESNEFATRRIQKLREQLPPIRHVNCGLLPCSKPSWQTALEVMDIFEGGWLHLHQNIAVKEIVETAQDTLEKIQTIAADMWNDGGTPRVLELQNVEQVKTYAPGVMHCVLDIFIPPAPS